MSKREGEKKEEDRRNGSKNEGNNKKESPRGISGFQLKCSNAFFFFFLLLSLTWWESKATTIEQATIIRRKGRARADIRREMEELPLIGRNRRHTVFHGWPVIGKEEQNANSRARVICGEILASGWKGTAEYIARWNVSPRASWIYRIIGTQRVSPVK